MSYAAGTLALAFCVFCVFATIYNAVYGGTYLAGSHCEILTIKQVDCDKGITIVTTEYEGKEQLAFIRHCGCDTCTIDLDNGGYCASYRNRLVFSDQISIRVEEDRDGIIVFVAFAFLLITAIICAPEFRSRNGYNNDCYYFS